MSLKLAIAAVAAAAQISSAAPSIDRPFDSTNLRLIKTSPEDPGQWVSEEQKFKQFTSKGIGFIDITNIQDQDVLDRLSTAPEDRITVHAVEYPTAINHRDQFDELYALSNITAPQDWLDHLASYFNRHYQSETGVEAAGWLFETVKSIAAGNPDITVEQFEHEFDQPSVIARIPGTTEDLVIAGAHYDSTSGEATDPAPGADDNASGTVTLLEALRVLVEGGFAPENTIELHWYGGEEAGLLGSEDVFADYSAQGKSVISYLNQDMAGYSENKAIAIITDYTDPALNEYITLLTTEYTGTAPNTMDCGYGCSDHASADAYGFPAAFAFEDVDPYTSPYIHTPNDKPDTIMWDSMEAHIKLTIGYLIEASYIAVA